MKKLFFITSTLCFVFSFHALAGGTIGGTGPSVASIDQFIPDLLKNKVPVSSDTFRRLNMRLSTSDVTPLFENNKQHPTLVKSMNGGIIDTTETFQVIVNDLN